MSQNLYMDLHVIQTLPPSCVNRDDTGSPKTAVYGGTIRARVSSQSWKRAMRMKFKELFTEDLIGYRTRKAGELVAGRICADAGDIPYAEAEKMADTVLALAGVKSGSDKKDTLFFISSMQATKLAELAVGYEEDKTAKTKKDKVYKPLLEKALNDDPSVDMLLFGRMAASNPSLNYDAAAQVAHSISTHTISNEYDYFTAVDDYEPEDNMGAGHIGTVEYNSSTLYRYATVNIRELAENLKADELKLAVRGFAEAFICSMPTGKKNTFANGTLPDMIYAVFREDQPVNLAGAFEEPVITKRGGYVRESEKKLAEYAQKVYKRFAAAPDRAWLVGEDLGGLAENVDLPELLEKIQEEVGRYWTQYCSD